MCSFIILLYQIYFKYLLGEQEATERIKYFSCCSELLRNCLPSHSSSLSVWLPQGVEANAFERGLETAA